jgi:hypothetical protein
LSRWSKSRGKSFGWHRKDQQGKVLVRPGLRGRLEDRLKQTAVWFSRWLMGSPGKKMMLYTPQLVTGIRATPWQSGQMRKSPPMSSG